MVHRKLEIQALQSTDRHNEFYVQYSMLYNRCSVHTITFIRMMSETELLRQSTLLMSLVVSSPGRLHRSAFHEAMRRAAEENATKMSRTPSAACSPITPRKGLSRLYYITLRRNGIKTYEI